MNKLDNSAAALANWDFANLQFGNRTAGAYNPFQSNEFSGDLEGLTNLLESGDLSPELQELAQTKLNEGLAAQNVSKLQGKESFYQGLGTFAQLGSAAFNAYTGWKQLGMAQQALDQNREAFEFNKGMQQDLYNDAVADKAARRKALGFK